MSLFPSTIIIASSLDSAQKEVINILSKNHHQLENNPDLFILSEYSIAAVREIKKFLSQKSFNHESKFVYLPEVDLLNHESQNALLKTLEEPGPNNYFLLTTCKISALLPTIISRCQKIRVTSTIPTTNTELWPITGSIKKDLDFAATINSDKSKIKGLLEEQLAAYQQKLIKAPDLATSRIIKKLLFAINLIDSNVDPKSALDYFFLR